MRDIAKEKELRLREQELTAASRAERPADFRPAAAARDGVLVRIGATALPDDLPRGYARLSPFDTVVEEIQTDGSAVPAADGPSAADPLGGQGTIWADLVKIGLPTAEAAAAVAAGLGLPNEAVRFAGAKDADAVSAQRISVRGAELSAAAQLNFSNIVLNRLAEGKGAATPGDLGGNRHTVFVRTERSFAAAALQAQVAEIESRGVANYFGAQRFGPPRFLSHLFGMLLCQGDFDGLVKAVLTAPSETEMPEAARLRAAAAKQYGDWSAMAAVFAALPYSFRHENIMLDTLARYPAGRGTISAVAAVPDQAEMWVRAYASYLANRVMAKAARGLGEVGEEIPFLLSPGPESVKPYLTYLRADRTLEYAANLARCRFLPQFKPQTVPLRLKPRNLKAAATDSGVALSFDLPKNAYAQTVLIHLFRLQFGQPIPEWVSREAVDVKEILGTGSLAGLRQRFGAAEREIMESRQEEE